MRTIQISTGVFAKIWAHRIDGEEDENTILERLLGIAVPPRDLENQEDFKDRGAKIRWRDDVKSALISLGGRASLNDLYDRVRDVRRKAGRSLPKNTEAIVRRELEYNSEHSKAHTGRFNWFRPAEGKLGKGVWELNSAERAQ